MIKSMPAMPACFFYSGDVHIAPRYSDMKNTIKIITGAA